ncbi:hypothetical protein GCM10022223_17060 [Kineosporia mesophila]|uniref:Lipoprotein n=1 Tax=Kineosporia mesophila TaxID=566012 RepID=A0ABP6Z959_9ACTN|nr:hypothetical protein [Kineosporia mesophila]MCD5352055.1 hypothetical protein [Kineosporia mesophila]
MRYSSALFMAALAGLCWLTGCSAVHSEDAGCARPDLVVEPEPVTIGSDVTVTGGPFLGVCADTTDNGKTGKNVAADEVRLYLVQGSTSTPLGAGVPDQEGQIFVTVTIPGTAGPGAAKISTDEKLPVSTRISLAE